MKLIDMFDQELSEANNYLDDLDDMDLDPVDLEYFEKLAKKGKKPFFLSQKDKETLDNIKKLDSPMDAERAKVRKEILDAKREMMVRKLMPTEGKLTTLRRETNNFIKPIINNPNSSKEDLYKACEKVMDYFEILSMKTPDGEKFNPVGFKIISNFIDLYDDKKVTEENIIGIRRTLSTLSKFGLTGKVGRAVGTNDLPGSIDIAKGERDEAVKSFNEAKKLDFKNRKDIEKLRYTMREIVRLFDDEDEELIKYVAGVKRTPEILERIKTPKVKENAKLLVKIMGRPDFDLKKFNKDNDLPQIETMRKILKQYDEKKSLPLSMLADGKNALMSFYSKGAEDLNTYISTFIHGYNKNVPEEKRLNQVKDTLELKHYPEVIDDKKREEIRQALTGKTLSVNNLSSEIKKDVKDTDKALERAIGGAAKQTYNIEKKTIVKDGKEYPTFPRELAAELKLNKKEVDPEFQVLKVLSPTEDSAKSVIVRYQGKLYRWAYSSFKNYKKEWGNKDPDGRLNKIEARIK